MQIEKEQKSNMETANNSKIGLTPFQIQMLELVSHVKTEKEMNDIRRLLAQYFAKRAEEEIEQLWGNGTLNEEIVEGWKYEHMRTPYQP